MNRNTLLAVVLSMSVLFVYEVFVSAPSRAKALKEAKVAAPQYLTSKSADVEAMAPENLKESTGLPKNINKSTISSKFYKIDAYGMGGALHNVVIYPQEHPMPIFDLLAVEGAHDSDFSLLNATPKQLIYGYKSSSLEIIKKFEFRDNTIISSLEIHSVGAEKGSLPKIKAFDIDSSRLENTNQRETMLDEYAFNVEGKIQRKGNASKFGVKESKTVEGKARWISFRDHYNTVVIKPLFDTKAVEIKQVSEKHLSAFIVPLNATEKYEFLIYAGPQDKAALKKADPSFSGVVAFSGFLPIEWIAQAIYHVTLWIQMVVKSWGLSIIFIGMLVYGMTYPLTVKSMLSMRKMQQSQPKILALRERFKDDPQRLNQEIVAIYKREKINPFGGCLPMLLQMPFFMAIYQVLWRAYYFQGKSFLWIKDLSKPDHLFSLPFSLPFLGSDFNILPLVMGGVMFWQQKLSAKTTVVTDETQAAQQKIMTVFFPIFIMFIFYKFASSLSLYFTMFYFFSALTQWKMSQTTGSQGGANPPTNGFIGSLKDKFKPGQ